MNKPKIKYTTKQICSIHYHMTKEDLKYIKTNSFEDGGDGFCEEYLKLYSNHITGMSTKIDDKKMYMNINILDDYDGHIENIQLGK